MLWMAVSRDKYELPLAVADSIEELAEVNHKDENRANNQADNLESCAHSTITVMAISRQEDLKTEWLN